MSGDGHVEDGPEVSTELKVTFWSLVVLVDVALLATALGVLLVVFDGRTSLGGASLVIGLLAFAVAARRVRAHRNA